MDRAQLRAELLRDEGGLWLRPYRDTAGYLTIGCGRNLTVEGLSVGEANLLLDNDITRVEVAALRAFPWFTSLTDARQRVLLNMAFNMGMGGLLGFHRMLAALGAEQYAAAAVEMLDSHWATQVGPRAPRLAALMRSG